MVAPTLTGTSAPPTDAKPAWLNEFESIQQNSFTTFLWYLLARLQTEGVEIPYEDDRPWQKLFYELQSSGDRSAPSFLSKLYFDSDGPYLYSHELVDSIQGLQLSASAAALNPTFDTIRLPETSRLELIEELRSRPQPYQDFLSKTAERAKELFRQAMDRRTAADE
jgi:hypothetical protein